MDKTNTMKNLRLFLVFFIISVAGIGYAQIGIQTNTPDASSALDIVSSNKGLLVPRVSLSNDLSSPSPVTSPATGLLVYNSGSNQLQGFYYWSGSAWVKLETGGGAITSWELTGNNGTTVGTNFLGTIDEEALGLRTKDVERMRILSDGRIHIANGYTAPDTEDKLTVRGNSTNTTAIYATSGFGYAVLGTSGSTFAMRAHSSDESGNGILATGNDVGGSYLNSGSGGSFTGGQFGTYTKAINEDGNGIVALGNDVGAIAPSSGSGGTFRATVFGIYAKAINTTSTGIAASGNNLSISTITGGSGGAFKGSKYGLYVKANNSSNGNGIGAVGNGGSTLYVPPTGSGGAFTGDSVGVYGKAIGSNGNGIIANGNGGNTYHYPTAGSGGSFTGDVGIYGYSPLTNGNAVVGLVNGGTYSVPGGTGSGGSFTGPIAVYGASSGSSGTAIIGVGNDGGNYHTLPDGSGGAFSGFHGMYGYAEDEDDGIGVLGVGNDEGSYSTYGYGAGGSFTGYRYGIEAFSNRRSSTSYGVYGKYNGGGSRNGVGVYGYSVPTSTRGYGVVGKGGNLGVLSINAMATIGNMIVEMDHPLDPRNKILNHYVIESPEVLNMYRGNVHLDEDGEATVSLPEYFSSININFSYALTPIGQQAPDLYIKEEIDNDGDFVIAGGNPNQKVSWVVYAERNDLYMQREKERKPDLVEIEKEDKNKGKYLMPELYNQPPEMGIFYSGENDVKKVDRKIKNQAKKVAKSKDIGEKESVVKERELKEKRIKN